MARLDLSGLDALDELMNGLSDLSTDINEVAKECIDAAAPTLVEALQSNIQSAANRGYADGSLAASISPTKAKTNAYGNFAAVRPVGANARGVRNAEKLAYLEYGTAKQKAHPVIKKAIAQAEPQTKEIIQKRFEERVKKYVKQ